MATDTVDMDTDSAVLGEAAPPTMAGSHRFEVPANIVRYVVLTVLAAVVLIPVVFSLIMSVSPPFEWVNAGRPFHPVHVDWKDRTWWTGGAFSVIVRTLLVAAAFAWVQWTSAKGGGPDKLDPTRSQTWRLAALGSVVAGTLALGFTTGPLFQSFHKADGRTLLLVVVASLVVAATQLPGFLVGAIRHPAWAVVRAVFMGTVMVLVAVATAGPEAWTQTWGRGNLGPTMARSLVVALAITVLQLATSVISAYAFVFLDFPFKRLLFGLYMATMLLPLEVTLVGNIATIRQLGWINSYQALILPFAATAFGTFLIRQGFRGIPPEIRDATRLDGYSHIGYLLKFAIPLARPVIASFTVISALGAWNQYLWPRAVIEDPEFNTAQIQLRNLISDNVANANLTTAAAIVVSVPVIALLIVFQRQIIRGLTAGAVK